MTSPLLSFGDCSTGCIRPHSWKIVPSISLQFSSLALTVILLLLITFFPSSEKLTKKFISCTFHSRNHTDYCAYCFRLGSYQFFLLGMTFHKDRLILSPKHGVHADFVLGHPFGEEWNYFFKSKICTSVTLVWTFKSKAYFCMFVVCCINLQHYTYPF